MVVDNQTLISSCVLNRERSWLDFKTAKMGNRSSWVTVSQNSTGNDDPCFLRVLKRESNALKNKVQCKRGEQKVFYACLLTAVALQDLLHS